MRICDKCGSKDDVQQIAVMSDLMGNDGRPRFRIDAELCGACREALKGWLKEK